MPVGAPVTDPGLGSEDGEVAAWFFNPNTYAITVEWTISATFGSMVVPAGLAVMGPHVGGLSGTDGAIFNSESFADIFYAWAQVDANDEGETAPWSFPLLSDSYREVLVSNGLG